MQASDFKARCLRILDEVARTGEPVTIVKRGRPVARLCPAAGGRDRYPQDSLRGTVSTTGDIVSPPLPPEAWDVERGP